MNIYTISGLGADQRVYQKLQLDYTLIPLDWIDPLKNETIEDYSIRLSSKIDQSQPFILIGVSFGGLVATEISKVLKPRLTILLSTVEVKSELPLLYRLFGKTRIIEIIPTFLFEIPPLVAIWLFGAEDEVLLRGILKDSDKRFTKWAVNQLVNWNNEERLQSILKISGSKDKLLPPDKSNIIIENGAHFMIVDRSEEVSKIMNNHLFTIFSK